MPGEKPRIVVVEDDHSMCRAIWRILQARGFAVRAFASAEAALEALATKTPDCMVVDVQLPGISGFDLQRLLKFDGKEIPTIFITAHDEPNVRDQAMKLGATCYLPKPFSGRTLLTAVTHAMHPPVSPSDTP